MRGLFITGTDTGVGKTFVACAMIRALRHDHHRVGAYKPACSGAVRRADGPLEWADVTALAAATDHQFPPERICPQCFTAPLAPPSAARAEGRTVDAALLAAGINWWKSAVDLLVVEGAGGLLSPLADELSNADLAQQLGYPVLIVAADRLGCINHTLLTVEVARARGLDVAGVILNQPTPHADSSTDYNLRDLTDRCPAPVLGVWPFAADRLLQQALAETRMNWRTLFEA